MADVVFITANKRANQGFEAEVKGFTDCTTSITHTFQNEVSELPIETGEAVSDHIQKKNNKFSIQGVYDRFSLVQYKEDAISYEDRLNKAYAFLLGLRDNKTVFTLITNLDVYENCAVSNLVFTTTPETSNSLSFSMDVTQIRTATVQRVNIVQVAKVVDSKKADAASSTPAGKQKTDTILRDVGDALTELNKVNAQIDAADVETKEAMKQGAKTQGGQNGG